MYRPSGIIKVVEWAFGGFASMLFPVIAALYWKRCSKTAVFASIIVSQFLNILLPLGLIPPARLGGFLPAFWAIVGGGVVLVAAALITPACDQKKTDDFFSSFALKTE